MQDFSENSLFPSTNEEVPGQTPLDSILVSQDALLLNAVVQLEACRTSLTLFATDQSGAISGVMTRGDVLRYLVSLDAKPDNPDGAIFVRDAMTPRMSRAGRSMCYLTQHGKSWYEQLSALRLDERWPRLKFLPVLDEDFKLVNVLDLESPRTRTRLETIVMALSFGDPAHSRIQTDSAILERRAAFDSISYLSHLEKVRGLCRLLSNVQDYSNSVETMRAIFNSARADELAHALFQCVEWIEGHVSPTRLAEKDQRNLRRELDRVRKVLISRYNERSMGQYYPQEVSSADVVANPQVIVALGCKDTGRLHARVQETWKLIHDLPDKSIRRTLVLSGGGSGHTASEAATMLSMLREVAKEKVTNSSISPAEKMGWWLLTTPKWAIDIVLEEDSQDTLGNAVFSWLTLRLEGDRFGLEAKSPEHLQRLVLVTDALHAPRSYDLFRRVFAFRKIRIPVKPVGIAVRTVASEQLEEDKLHAAEAHLRSEAETNNKIFRLVNPLTNGFDVIDDGHVRSILGQMIRLHRLYVARWDLVRKYQACWPEEPIQT